MHIPEHESAQATVPGPEDIDQLPPHTDKEPHAPMLTPDSDTIILAPEDGEESPEDDDESPDTHAPNGPDTFEIMDGMGLDDFAGVELAADQNISPKIAIDDEGKVFVYKAKVLRTMYKAEGSSRERLQRVAALKRYGSNDAVDTSVLDCSNSDGSAFGRPRILVDEPAATIIRVEGRLFFAIIQITRLTFDKVDVQQIPLEILPERTVSVGFKVICLTQNLSVSNTTGNDQNTEVQWDWNLTYSSSGMVAGRLVQPVNPMIVDIRPQSNTPPALSAPSIGTSPPVTSSPSHPNDSLPMAGDSSAGDSTNNAQAAEALPASAGLTTTTMRFSSDDLRGLGAALFSSLTSVDLEGIPSVTASAEFPYRDSST